jgi:ABC-type branched-subunit amino acid transport system substrate-binding protein
MLGATVGLVAVVGLVTASGVSRVGAAASLEDGVTAKSVKIGYVFSKTGVAGSTFVNADKGCQARIDRQNAAGGVNGRKIDVEMIDDQSSGANLTGAQDLVQNKHVFMVINNSSFAFLTYRWLEDHNVPMIGGGYDGTYYGVAGNEKVISALGNTVPQYGVANDGLPKFLKALGVTKMAVGAYGVSPSSTNAAESLQKFGVPAVGIKPVYTNTTIDFGTTDVGPFVLGIKNSGADGVWLPFVANTNVAVSQGLVQNGVKMKAVVWATGYGQPLLDQPVAKTLPPNNFLGQAYWAPVELKTKGTKQFQADLKKVGYAGVPDFGVYTGYVTCDLAILGLQHAGNPPTRQGFIDGLHKLGHFNPGDGLGCQDVDISLEHYGQAPPTVCSYYLQVKNGKFVVYKQKNGDPVWKGKLIQASTQATTTTTAAPQ